MSFGTYQKRFAGKSKYRSLKSLTLEKPMKIERSWNAVVTGYLGASHRNSWCHRKRLHFGPNSIRRVQSLRTSRRFKCDLGRATIQKKTFSGKKEQNQTS